MTRAATLLGLVLAVLALGAGERVPARAEAARSGARRRPARVALARREPLRARRAPSRAARVPRGSRPAAAARRASSGATSSSRTGSRSCCPRSRCRGCGSSPACATSSPPARTGLQLDSTPQQIGASALWGAGLSTAGQGVKIGIIDSGVDHTHAFFDPAGYTMPAGFPKGQTQFTSAKVIVARAFAPPTAKTQAARLAFDGNESSHGTHVAGIAAGNPGTRGRGRDALGNRPARVHRELQGARPHGLGPEPERELAGARRRDRGSGPGRDGRDQPLARRARDRAEPRHRRARARRRRASGRRPGRRRGERLQRHRRGLDQRRRRTRCARSRSAPWTSRERRGASPTSPRSARRRCRCG